jgi:hypothetical protein
MLQLMLAEVIRTMIGVTSKLSDNVGPELQSLTIGAVSGATGTARPANETQQVRNMSVVAQVKGHCHMSL